MSNSKRAVIPLLLCLAPLASAAARTAPDSPPAVLIVREFPKPVDGSPIREHAQAANSGVAKGAKPLSNYLYLTSMTGPEKVLIMSGYPSFIAMEPESKDHPMIGGGRPIASTDTSEWALRPDLSLDVRNMVGVRYIEYQVLITKPGRQKEIDEWLKMYVAGFKGIPGYNWATYQQAYGTNYNAVLFVARYKTQAEVDAAWAFGGSAMKTFGEALGEAGLKKLHALEADIVDWEMTNLFRIDPELSRPPEEVIKAEPTFWRPTSVSSAKK